MRFFSKVGLLLLSITTAGIVSSIDKVLAAFHGSASTSFNNGKFELNLNFPSIGGDYPFINLLKNMATPNLGDSSGNPAPNLVDANGYPTSALNTHSGIFNIVRIPAQAYVGNNCANGASAICFAFHVTGKGTVNDPGAVITATASSVVSTGSVVTVTFAAAQDFRAGMEVPLSGTTGLTASNGGGGSLAAGGTTGAWTVCAAGLTPTTIQLCLNDQATNVTTTAGGSGSGTTVVSYGRNAVGVLVKGRVVSAVSGSPVSVNVGISSTDATNPISNLAMVLEGSEEVRWESGQIFSAKLLSTVSKAGVERALNVINTNASLEVNWCDRKPTTYFSYASDLMDSPCGSVFAGTTTSVGNDYSITFGSGAPTDRQKIILSFDAATITSTNSSVTGVAAVLNFPLGHNMKAGDPFNLFTSFTGTAPINAATSAALPTSSAIYYVTTSIDANNINFTAAAPYSPLVSYAVSAVVSSGGTLYTSLVASNKGNTPASSPTQWSAGGASSVSTTSTGTGTLFGHKTAVNSIVAFTNSGTNLNWPNHNLNVGDPVGCNNLPLPSGALPTNMIATFHYFVQNVVDANNVNLSLTSGGSAITFGTSTGSPACIREPTLSINSSAAVPIRDPFANPLAMATQSAPLAFLFGKNTAFAEMTFDQILNSWVKTGSDASVGNSYITSGWPPEIFFEFCKEVGAHPWIPSPRWVLDGATGLTDYMPNLMLYGKTFAASNAPWMIPRYEVCNEWWNSLFGCTALGVAHAQAFGTSGITNGTATSYYAGWTLTNPVADEVGKAGSVLGQAASAIYGGVPDSTKYQLLVGIKTFDFYENNSVPANSGIQRITSTNYIAQSTAAQSSLTGPFGTINFTKTPAFKWMTHIPIAEYWGPGLDGSTYVASVIGPQFAAGAITGSISGNVLTVTSLKSGTLDVGTNQFYGPGVPQGLSITIANAAGCGGTCTGNGGTGTYQLNQTLSNPVGSTTITFVQSTSVTSGINAYIDSALNNATGLTVTANGTSTITISAPTGGPIGGTGLLITPISSVGGFTNSLADVLVGGGLPNFIQLCQQLTGTPNGAGTYKAGNSSCGAQNVAAGTYTNVISVGENSLPIVQQLYINANTLAANAIYCNGDNSCDGVHSFYQQVNGYEGGYSPSQPLYGTTQGGLVEQYGKYVTSTPNAANGLQTYVTQNCMNFASAGGQFCSLFQLSGISPDPDPWSALGDIWQPGPTPYMNGYNALWLLKRDIDPAGNDNDPMWLEKAA